MRIADLSVAFVCAGALALQPSTPVAQTLRWEDLPAPTGRRLIAAGLDAPALPAFLEKQEKLTQERVRESDLDALIYYALQSTTFTNAAPLEPAVSAKAFVDRLDVTSRERFLSDQLAPIDRVPVDARERLTRVIDALREAAPQSRLAYFRDLVPQVDAQGFLLQQYVRAARFLYEKEFVAPARPDSVDAIAALYRQRALSTDTSVEAGYLVHLGLATLRATDAERRVRRVLIVGPGLELAPRTGLVEVGPPQSYQPYAVLDALVSLGLSRMEDVAVLCADVNPRVVDHLRQVGAREALTLISGVGASATITLREEYQLYFDGLGRSIGYVMDAPVLPAPHRGHLSKSVRLRPEVSRAIGATGFDVARERLSGEPFDLIVATNVLVYLDDVPLMLALSSIGSMLAPGGALIHNEARALVGAVTAEQALPLVHARTAQLATVQGATTPLYDTVFVHVKRG